MLGRSTISRPYSVLLKRLHVRYSLGYLCPASLGSSGSEPPLPDDALRPITERSGLCRVALLLNHGLTFLPQFSFLTFYRLIDITSLRFCAAVGLFRTRIRGLELLQAIRHSARVVTGKRDDNCSKVKFTKRARWMSTRAPRTCHGERCVRINLI
jgi:hypothetical protein